MTLQRNLSFSQIKEWLNCRQAWEYKFHQGYRPNRPKIEFTRGTLLHVGMEKRIRDLIDGTPGGNWWTVTYKEWLEEWGKVLGPDMIVDPGWFEGCRYVVEQAVDVLLADYEVLSDAKGLLLERRLYASLPRFYKAVVFIPDAVCRKRTTGGVLGIDFKSFGKPKLEMAGVVDLQGAIYQRGLREHGHEAIGSCLFQIAQEPPKVARINKDGSEHAGDIKTRDNWRPVLGAIETLRSPEFLNNVWERVVLECAREMWEVETDLVDNPPAIIPSLDYYSCQYCDYFEPCQASLKDHDEAAILAESFSQRVKR